MELLIYYIVSSRKTKGGVEMERWNSYDQSNDVNEIKTFEPSVQTFESTPQSRSNQSDYFETIRCDIPVIVTRIEHHHYCHQYIYRPVTKKEVNHYHRGSQFFKKSCDKGQNTDKQ